jgi:hypothetical protein
MPITRRHFLRAGSVAMVAASAATSLRASTAERWADATVPTGRPTFMSKATFAAHLNTVFLIKLNDKQEVPLELVALHDCGPAKQREKAARAGQECFALAFRPRPGQTLKQNTYALEHRVLGRFDLFIAPVKSKKHGQVYEAIINHVRV